MKDTGVQADFVRVIIAFVALSLVKCQAQLFIRRLRVQIPSMEHLKKIASKSSDGSQDDVANDPPSNLNQDSVSENPRLVSDTGSNQGSVSEVPGLVSDNVSDQTDPLMNHLSFRALRLLTWENELLLGCLDAQPAQIVGFRVRGGL
ncbi:hypothetical protein ACLMJK_006214 [Lecanora helva]